MCGSYRKPCSFPSWAPGCSTSQLWKLVKESISKNITHSLVLSYHITHDQNGVLLNRHASCWLEAGCFYVYCYYMQHLHGGPHFSWYLIKSYPNGTVVMFKVVPLNQDSSEPHTLSLIENPCYDHQQSQPILEWRTQGMESSERLSAGGWAEPRLNLFKDEAMIPLHLCVTRPQSTATVLVSCPR